MSQIPPTTAPPGVASADVRPTARWFWIGGAVMVFGIVGAIAFGVVSFLGIRSTIDDFARVSEGSDTIRIDSPGSYVVYKEGGGFSTDIEIVSPDGEIVSTSRYLTSLTYTQGGRSGQAVATFDADGTGPYTVTSGSDVAIGPSIAGDLVRTLLVPILIGGVGILTGLVIVVVTAVRRSGSKRRALAG